MKRIWDARTWRSTPNRLAASIIRSWELRHKIKTNPSAAKQAAHLNQKGDHDHKYCISEQSGSGSGARNAGSPSRRRPAAAMGRRAWTLMSEAPNIWYLISLQLHRLVQTISQPVLLTACPDTHIHSKYSFCRSSEIVHIHGHIHYSIYTRVDTMLR
jgi:hypothetical protein